MFSRRRHGDASQAVGWGLPHQLSCPRISLAGVIPAKAGIQMPYFTNEERISFSV